MAEASGELQRVMAKYPEISELARQKSDMAEVLRDKGMDAILAKDFSNYAEWIKNTFSFSIDTAFREAKYVDYANNKLTEVYLSMLQETVNLNKGTDMYGAGTFKGNTKLIYAQSKPCETSLDECFRGCINLVKVDNIDTSDVRSLNYTFNGCKNLSGVLEIDCSNVTSMQYTFGGGVRLDELRLLNMSGGLGDITYNSKVNLYQCFYGAKIRKITGLNLKHFAGGKTSNSFALINGTLEHIDFTEDSFIRYGRYIDMNSSNFDRETQKAIYLQAYDWTNNPCNLTPLSPEEASTVLVMNTPYSRLTDEDKAEIKEILAERGWGVTW